MTRTRVVCGRSAFAAVVCLAIGPAWPASPSRTAAPPSLPAWFEPNRGQLAAGTAFFGRGKGYAIALDHAGVTRLILPHEGSGEIVRLDLEGARASTPVGEEPRASFTRLYRGGEALTETMLPHFGRTRSAGVYPGIDFLWIATGDAFRYEFHLQPDADPRSIRMHFDGIRSLDISSEGDLIVQSAHGQVRYARPVAFQPDGRERLPVQASYRIDGHVAAFDLGRYDRSKPLVVDPLMTSTYLGGSGFDAANSVALDGSGNIYLAGETSSTDLRGRATMNRAAFVAQLSPDASALRYVTILASGGNDRGSAVAVDKDGNVYVGGSAGGAKFPLTSTALASSVTAVPVAFVAKLGKTGQLLYSTFFGRDNTAINALAVDASANVYVAGSTGSMSFPSTPTAPQRILGGATDGFVAKLNLSAPAIVYATLVGGSGFDSLAGIAVNASGAACVLGSTTSIGLPVRNAIQPSNAGNQDAMVGCLDPAGSSWNFLTYLGGTNPEIPSAIGLDPEGNPVVVGATMSANFPKTASSPAPRDYDAFVTKLRANGSGIVFSTVIGGGGSDIATTVTADSPNGIWIGGYTSSLDFPQRGAVQSRFGGQMDGFVANLSSENGSLSVSTYLGGAGDDRVLAIASRQPGKVVVVGMTGSIDFPTTLAQQNASAGSYDAFLSILSTNKKADSPGVFSAGAWTLDLNGNRFWDSPPSDRSMYLGQAGDIPVVGDWNGDGRSKAGVFRNGLWVLDYNGDGAWGSGDRFFYLGESGDTPVVGDWNGDGRAKGGVFRNGLWVLDYNGDGAWGSADRFFYLGERGDKAVVGDWNGDGRTKGGVFRNGLWVLDYNGDGAWGSADRFFYLGERADIPVIGDWNGDGRAKGGIFRNGLWVLDYNGDGAWGSADRFFYLGQAGHTPVAGDWTGDGRVKAGTFSLGAWLCDLSGTGSAVVSTFGASTDVPVKGKW
jgi:hypothetical protein